MPYISRFDMKFITKMNRKYAKYHVRFEYFDDYIMWLYYYLCHEDEKLYYYTLEDDLWEYSNFQTGDPRIKEKNNPNWKEMEEDRFGIYKTKIVDIKEVEHERRNRKKEKRSIH